MENISIQGERVCETRVADHELCDLDNIDVSKCSGLTVACCNRANVRILTCPPNFVLKAALSAASTTWESQGIQPQVLSRLQNYFRNKALPLPPVANGTETIMQMTRIYLTDACQAFDFTSQIASLPKLTAYDCSNDLVDLYNQSDVRIRCAAGALVNLFPDTPATPSQTTTAWYQLSEQTLPVIAALGIFSVVAVLMVVILYIAKLAMAPGPYR
jgi:hypothetical protein